MKAEKKEVKVYNAYYIELLLSFFVGFYFILFSRYHFCLSIIFFISQDMLGSLVFSAFQNRMSGAVCLKQQKCILS
jgi:hypothetical protein